MLIAVVYLEVKRRLSFRGIFGLAILVFLYVSLVVVAWSAMKDLVAVYEEIMKSLPEGMLKVFAKTGAVAVFNYDFYYVIEYYGLFVVLLMSIYYAYTSASSIVNELEAKTAWILHSGPIRRYGIVLGKFIGVLISITLTILISLVISIALPHIIGEDINSLRYAELHLTGMLYLAACATLGFLLATIMLSKMAPALSAVIVGAMYFMDTLTINTDLEKLGALAFSRYYDFYSILVEGEVNLNNFLVLVIVTMAFIVVALLVYGRKDIHM